MVCCGRGCGLSALRRLDRTLFGDRRLPPKWLYALVFLAIGSVPLWGGVLSDLAPSS
jgi:hypothetical protein